MMGLHVVLAVSDFPLWIRVTHYTNLLFMFLLMRAGLQILVAHPRLYWNSSCKPGSEWLKFTTAKVPTDRLYTAMDDERSISPWLALPGKDELGMGRHWHFFCATFWMLSGLVYVVLLFATGEWTRLIPTSWDIVPRAWHTALIYGSFHIPPASDFRPFDPLQQLAYAAIVFLLAPFQIITAFAMSPAIEARFPWFVKLLGGKQGARSLHFIGLVLWALFGVVHITLVFVVHFQDNVRNIIVGNSPGAAHTNLTLVMVIFFGSFAVALLIAAWASWYTLGHRRQMQHVLGAVVDPIRMLSMQRLTTRQHYTNVSSYFWTNGYPPETAEYKRLVETNFADYRLEVSGLVDTPLCLSLDDLRAMAQESQTTLHNCIQGWSGIAAWTGVPITAILQRCGASPRAKYLVFTSYQQGKQSFPQATQSWERPFYEALPIIQAKHPQTILALEMNGEPLPVNHGAPVRLRVETYLGYKMVKWVRSIELVEEYTHLWDGQGGFREDNQYYGTSAEI